MIAAVWLLAALMLGPQSAESPRAVRTTVLQTLINDPELGQYALAASVDDQFRVVLRGTLPSKSDKELAERLVKSVAGVKGVDNQIQVGTVAPLAAGNPAAAAASDADVETAVANALRARPELAGVSVRVSQQQIQLEGTVASAADRRRAEALAKKNAAGMKVVDAIQVQKLAGLRL